MNQLVENGNESINLQSLIDELGISILVVEVESERIVSCNRAATSLLGFNINDIVGLSFSEICITSPSPLHAVVENRKPNKLDKFITQYRTISGNLVNVELFLSPISVSERLLLLVFSFDITRRIEAEKKLKQNLQIFETLFRDNTLPLILLDPEKLTVVETNEIAQQFLGYPSIEIIGCNLGKFSTMAYGEFNQTLRSFIDNKYSGLEVTLVSKQLLHRDVEMHYTLTDFEGNKLILIILVDVTERNSAIKALQKIKENLANEVRKQTEELVTINNSLLEQISFREAAEVELIQSQELFYNLFQLNPNGMILKSKDNQSVKEVNNSFLSTFGLQKSDIIGKKLEDLDILCNSHLYTEQVLKVNDGIPVKKVPLTMMSKKGHVRFILFSAEHISLKQNRSVILEVFQDITEIQITQQKLEFSERRYRTMFNNALVGIFQSEVATGIVLDCNLQFARMLGYKTTQELIGRSMLNHYPSEKFRESLIQKLSKGKTNVFEYEMVTKEAKSIYVVNYAQLFTVEGYIEGVIVDITDRKLMEELLSRSEVRFRSMIENATDVILILNKDGFATYLSPSVKKELGYSFRVEAQPNILKFLHPADAVRVEGLLQDMKLTTFNDKVRVRHRNGSYRIFEFRATNLSNDSYINGIIVNARDVTEQEKAREETSIALQREQELSRQKSLFISTVSHEFRTPLTNISLNIQLLQKYINDNKVDKASQGLERMGNAIKRLTALLNEVSLISKDQSGRLQFSPESWSSSDLIDSLFDELSYLLQPNVEVEIHRGIDQPVMADKTLISHILVNLLSNAIKYSPNKDKVIFKVRFTSDSTLEIFVKDYGIGIPEGEIQFLFDPYFRATNVKQITGTGLGLSIVKRCVDLHNGKIHVDSQIDMGTTFTCTIPLNIDSQV